MFVMSSKLPILQQNTNLSRVDLPPERGVGGGGEEATYCTTEIIVFNIRVSKTRGNKGEDHNKHNSIFIVFL